MCLSPNSSNGVGTLRSSTGIGNLLGRFCFDDLQGLWAEITDGDTPMLKLVIGKREAIAVGAGGP